MTTLIIARHGNTFEADEKPRRVGAKTDIPLTDKGREQASAIGRWLKDNDLVPDVTYSSTLKRTVETGEIAAKEAGFSQPAYQLDIFNEIDYGPDENKLEEDVIARIGSEALKEWDNNATVPEGWNVDPEQIIQNWIGFGEQVRVHDDGEVILVVTSNGIARFAPYLCADAKTFYENNNIKISTGSICVFHYVDGEWVIKEWNLKPSL